MKNKYIIIVGIVVVLIVIVIVIFNNINSGTTNSTSTKVETSATSTPQINVSLSTDGITPARSAEINGDVLSIEGNEVKILRYLETLTDEEKAARKAEKQALTQEERQALRSAELESVQSEEVTVLIPVGTRIVKTASTGDQSASGTVYDAKLSDIVKGIKISIWMSNDNVEIVKLKGIQ